MALEEAFENLFSGEEITTEKILSTLLESDKHLNMKTHILNPLEMSGLDIIIAHLKICKMKKTATMLEVFTRHYKEYMVSWKRLSRGEIERILIAIREQKTNANFTQKLLGMKGSDK